MITKSGSHDITEWEEYEHIIEYLRDLADPKACTNRGFQPIFSETLYRWANAMEALLHLVTMD